MKRFILLLALVLSSHAFADDVTDAFIKCANTKNDKVRLACYDKIRDDIVRANKPTSSTEYQVMDIDDLKVDIKKLYGQKISVAAYIQTLGGMSMLKTNGMDMTPIIADADNLPRDDRKKLNSGCDSGLCEGIFYGIPAESPMGPQFVIEKVEWHQPGD
jgi:hypothetical protein